MRTCAQVARVLEAQGRLQKAANWLVRVCMAVPHDAGILTLLGSLHARLGSESDALRCPPPTCTCCHAACIDLHQVRTLYLDRESCKLQAETPG